MRTAAPPPALKWIRGPGSSFSGIYSLPCYNTPKYELYRPPGCTESAKMCSRPYRGQPAGGSWPCRTQYRAQQWFVLVTTCRTSLHPSTRAAPRVSLLPPTTHHSRIAACRCAPGSCPSSLGDMVRGGAAWAAAERAPPQRPDIYRRGASGGCLPPCTLRRRST